MDNLTLWLIILGVVILFSLGMMAYTSVKQKNK